LGLTGVDGETLLPLKLPALPGMSTTAPTAPTEAPDVDTAEPEPVMVVPPVRWEGGPVEFDRVAPPSGNPVAASPRRCRPAPTSSMH